MDANLVMKKELYFIDFSFMLSLVKLSVMTFKAKHMTQLRRPGVHVICYTPQYVVTFYKIYVLLLLLLLKLLFSEIIYTLTVFEDASFNIHVSVVSANTAFPSVAGTSGRRGCRRREVMEINGQ